MSGRACNRGEAAPRPLPGLVPHVHDGVYVVGDAGYVLYAYDHRCKEGADDALTLQILKSLHKT